MNIENKEDFVKLLIATMSRTGYIVETFNFKKELPLMMSDKRYDSLFYFVNELNDLDLLNVLLKYKELGYIDTNIHEDGRVTIHIESRLSYCISSEILGNFDDYLFKLMKLFIRELDISRSISSYLPSEVITKYSRVNPNGIYNLKGNNSIITDGIVKNGKSICTGAVIVENASFLTEQSYIKGRLMELQIFYRFDNKSDIWLILKDIISYLDRIDKKKKNLYLHGDESIEDRFTELEICKGYKYRRY